MRNLCHRLTLAILLIPIFAAEGAQAQTNAEVNAGIQFNFSTPGARSLGMGGAFIGLADDATAAYANPAGLTILSRPEVSLETRHWHLTNVFTDRGRLADAPTNTGVDTISGLRTGQRESDLNGVSFFSYVYPKSRWTFALYRHELINFGVNYDTQGAFLQGGQGDGPNVHNVQRLRPTRNKLNLKVVNLGIANAFRISDKLSIGVELSSYDFKLHSTTSRFELIPGQFNQPDYSSDHFLDSQTQSGSTQKLAFNAGFLWQPNATWKLGGVYRQGPKFDFDAGYSNPKKKQTIRRQAVFNIPDVFGLGVSCQPTELSSILLDVVRVRYSDLTRKFTDIFPPSDTTCPSGHCHFEISDATEIHLGFEQNFSTSNALVAARIGAWYDPDHRLRYIGDDLGYRAIFQPGKDEIHYSAGIGYISSKLPLQLDAAVDITRRARTVSFSTVIRF